MTNPQSAPERPRLLLALDRMIESVQEDIPRSTDDEDVAYLRGELKGLMAARAYAEGEAARAEVDAPVYEEVGYINSDCFVEWDVPPFNMEPSQRLYVRRRSMNSPP